MAPLGLIRSALLVMGSWCTVLAAGAIAPVLPQMRAVFADTPSVDLLIGFVATAPSLAVALLALPIGFLADRIGLRPVLLGGLLIFGFSGVAPLFLLDTLPQIVALRFVTGIGEAAVMTASTALIGLMTIGAGRSRLLAAQAVSANLLGIGVLLAGGAAGLLGWRMPFLAYAFSLVIFVPVLVLIRPATDKPSSESTGERARWPRALSALLVETCLLIAWSTIGLYAAILEVGFLLAERGATDSAQIGIGQAIVAIGITSGAMAGGLLARTTTRFRLILAYGAIAVGAGLIAIASGRWDTSVAGALAGFGCGLMIPTLLSRLLGQSPAGLLGRVTGIWVAATFLAQFASPPLFLLLRRIAGSMSGGFALFGAITLIFLLVISVRRDRWATK